MAKTCLFIARKSGSRNDLIVAFVAVIVLVVPVIRILLVLLPVVGTFRSHEFFEAVACSNEVVE